MLIKKLLFCFVGAAFLVTPAISQQVWDLQKCINYAFENNIQIKQSELVQENNQLGVTQSKANLLPTVNGQATHGYNFGQTIDPFTNQFATARIRNNSLGVSTNVTIFNGFQNMNAISRSKYDLKASEQETEKMKNDVALNIANAYLQILFGKELLKIAENQLSLSTLQAERVKKLVDAGQLPLSNYLDIQAQVANEELNRVNNENNLSFAYLQLFQLLQLPANDKIEIETPEFRQVSQSLLKGSPENIYQAAVTRLPEIKSQELRLKSSEKSLDIAYGGMSPRLTFNASYGSGYSGNNRIGVGDLIIGAEESGSFILDGNTIVPVFRPTINYSEGFKPKSFRDQIEDNVNQSVSFSLIVPIFNGLQTNTNIKRNRNNVINSKLQLDAQKNTLEQTIQRAYNDALAAFKKYQASEKAVSSLQEAFKYAEIRFQQNLINSVDYTDAKIKLTNAQSELIRSKYDYIFKAKILDFYRGENLTLN